MKFTISETPVQKEPVFQMICLKDIAVGTAFRYSDSRKYQTKFSGADTSTYIKLPKNGKSMDALLENNPDNNDTYWPVFKINKDGTAEVTLFHNKNKWYFFEVEINARHISPYPINTQF